MSHMLKPTLPFPNDVAANIKLIVLDVDGVMTDGGLYYSIRNEVMKRFDVQDGLGIKIAQNSGLHVAVITGIVSKSVEKRMEDLGISDYYAGFLDKRESLDNICNKYNLPYNAVAYIGDDWVDIKVMQKVGLPIAVANAQPEVKKISKYITISHGGQGAVREVIRHLLIAQGKFDHALSTWSLV